MSGQGATLGGSNGGIVLAPLDGMSLRDARKRVGLLLRGLGIEAIVDVAEPPVGLGPGLRCWLTPRLSQAWCPDGDTLDLARQMDLAEMPGAGNLQRETLLAMLAGPVPFVFPGFDELAASLRIRHHIVRAAQRTALGFDTRAIERPAQFWTYNRGRGFTLLPGTCLIEALRAATQPGETGATYAFSCYRATEYVILLAIAQELRSGNPPLYHALQAQWQDSAIQSGAFHRVFMHEYGTQANPLPATYYVPGDRLWFRNPDDASSDVSGYEGSWVFYLGGGLFSNFWKAGQPYTMTSKCVEIYHWRHATWRDADGELQMDEARVDSLVRATLADPAEVARVMALMMRRQDPKGVYASGGCIDATREYPRRVCQGTADLALREAVAV